MLPFYFENVRADLQFNQSLPWVNFLKPDKVQGCQMAKNKTCPIWTQVFNNDKLATLFVLWIKAVKAGLRNELLVFILEED